MKKTNPKTARKAYLTTVWLSLFLGALGADRFYLGKWRSGLLKLITLGGLGFWLIIDAVLIIIGRVKDINGHKLLGFKINSVTIKFSGLILVVMLTATTIFEVITPPSSTQSNGNYGNINGGLLAVISLIGLGLIIGWLLFIIFTVVDAYRRGDWIWTMVNILSFFFIFGILNIIYYHFVRNKSDDLIL